MKLHLQKAQSSGYTLVEALVSSAILMIGIAAAASMSLTMLTQEEINERTVRAMNYLDNTASLYRMGLDSADIESIMPAEPVVTNLTFDSSSRTVSGLGTVDTMRINVVYKPTAATESYDAGEALSGDKSVRRNHTVEVFRGSQYVTP